MKKNYMLCILLCALNAMAQPGTLDTTFGTGGKVHTGFGVSNGQANAVAVQPDGKIIVGGMAFTANTVTSYENDTNNAVLVRYNADGSKDMSFGSDGVVMNDYYTVANAQGHNSYVRNIKVLPEGKILTYGGELLGYVPNTVLARYNSDGSLDTTFGNNGHLLCNSSPIGGADSMLIQPDGKIVVLGILNLQPVPGVYTAQFVVERYNADGTKDTGFGVDGTVFTSFGYGYEVPRAVALQPDGKIIAVGVTFDNKFAMARYTENGQPDTTFDGDGKVITSFGTGTYAHANFVSVHSDGKILVAGTSWNFTGTTVTNFSLARYNANGSLDTSFDSDGKATTPFDNADLSTVVTSVLEQPDGKLLITTTTTTNSYTYDLTDDFTTRRYNPDATVDTSFGTNGKVSTACQEGYNRSIMATVQPDGKILAVGFSHPLLSEQNDFNVVRYEGNGTLDTSFDADGKISTAFDSSNDEGRVLLVQPDNTLIVIGTKRNYKQNTLPSSDIALSKYTGDGSPDSSFGTEGKAVSVFGQNVNRIVNAVLQPDGKIIVSNAYYTYFGDNLNHYELIRYTANGAIDTTFGNNGKVITNFECTTVICQPDGKILTAAGGYNIDTEAQLVILNRFNTNGTPDTGFGNNGTANLETVFNGPIIAALQPDGKIVVCYSAPDSNGSFGIKIARFNADGSLDDGFGDNSPLIVDLTCYAKSIFVQPDGTIIVAGRSFGYDGWDFHQFVMARYSSDGILDATYGTDGIITTYLGNFFQPYTEVQSVAQQPDGKFLIAISKIEPTNLNSYDFVVFRINANGTYDADFGTNGQLTTSIYNKYDEAFSIALQSDNKIVMAGTTDTGINRDFALVRYDNSILNVNAVHQNAAGIMLYPNPANDVINIKLPANSTLTVTKCSIYNMLGQVVYESTDKNLQVAIAKFSPGIYNLVLKTDKGNQNGRFIKE